MKSLFRRFASGGIAMLAAAFAHAGVSVFTQCPDDPAAVVVGAPACGDGVADDTAALQAAIDRVQETTRRGLVLLPEGRYRLTHELRVWSGIRLIGFGSHRPVLLLGANTPGYDSGPGRYLVHFVSDRPESPDQPVRDANPGTFYSAISNVDVEIGAGNPAAVGVRAHYAQHCFLAHMDFHVGGGRAGIEEAGNLAEDLSFDGGEFGITTHKPSPSWPFLLLDSRFSRQSKAAIETEEAGLTLVRDQFADVPAAVLVRPDRAEELYLEDCRMERIAGPALVVGGDRNARTQVNAKNCACVDVPVFMRLRETGKEIAAPGPGAYVVGDLCQGAQDLNGAESFGGGVTFAPSGEAAAVPTDIASLPPMATWVNVRSLGAKGDGTTDDTAALQAAIAAHDVLYFPSGRYRVSDTIELRPATVLIGLNPITTEIFLADRTPAFQGPNAPAPRAPSTVPGRRGWPAPPPFPGKGAPKPMLAAPHDGTNIITGIGLDCGGSNNRAVALKWSAGSRSLVDDVRFLGGHGTYGPDGRWLAIYNDTRTGDPDPQRRWDSEFWSLWVTDGGGGVFKDIWTPDTFAAAGLYVSDTATRGRVYALSSEHHVRNEVKLNRVSHWKLYALQTEEERGESPRALPLEIRDCTDVGVENFFIYRVDLPVPGPTGILVSGSHQLEFCGLHVYSPGKLSFDQTFVDQTSGRADPSRELARLQWTDGSAGVRPVPRNAPAKVAGGFGDIDGIASDGAGGVYFVDASFDRIFHFSAAQGVSLVTDAISQPVALAVARSGELLVVTRHGNVYAYRPGASEATIVAVTPSETAPPAGSVAWLPVNRWRDDHDWLEANTRTEPLRYRSTDGSIFIPAPRSFPQLAERARGTIDVARAYALAPAAGPWFYVADEFGQTTWRFRTAGDGTLSAPELVAQEGEAGTAVAADGTLSICAGRIFVQRPGDARRDAIDVPERPAGIALGGPEQRTLYIAARTSLYALELDRSAAAQR